MSREKNETKAQLIGELADDFCIAFREPFPAVHKGKTVQTWFEWPTAGNTLWPKPRTIRWTAERARVRKDKG